MVKNTSIELAVALMLKACILYVGLCNVPSIVLSDICKGSLDGSKYELFIVFTVIGGFISFFFNVSSEEQTKQEALKESVILLNSM
jgi:hypothetical protein